MRDILRRNLALAVLGVLAIAALVTTSVVSAGSKRAAFTGCGFGYDPSIGNVGYGTGYGYGYGTCSSGGGGSSGTTTTSSTSTTSTTSPAGPPPQVISGTNREGTAIAASQATFPNPGSAKAVILTRDDLFPDALGGSRLAVVKDGPLLLTPSTSLDPSTEAEIKRVLPAGGTVFVLGGTSAIVPAIVTQLQADGFVVIRIGGADRFATAVDIANEDTNGASTSSAGAHIAAANGPAAPILIATGLNFPDGLAAGADASKIGAAVVLSNGSSPTPATTAYIQAHPGVPLFAVGGPAAQAYPTATPIVGATRYETAVDLANEFFSSPSVVGIATGAQFPDALSGGAAMGEYGGPLLLTDPNSLSSATSAYLTANKATIKQVYVFGGTSAVSQNDLTEIAAAQA